MIVLWLITLKHNSFDRRRRIVDSSLQLWLSASGLPTGYLSELQLRRLKGTMDHDLQDW